MMAGNGYAANTSYALYISTGTVGRLANHFGGRFPRFILSFRHVVGVWGGLGVDGGGVVSSI